MRNRSNMRPQDIVILLKIITIGKNQWKQIDIANSLKISPSEIAESLERSKTAKLIDSNKKNPLKSNLIEFITHGLKYVFPATIGPQTRGIPTAHSSQFMSKKIISDDVYVWPYYDGTVRGASIEPLYKSVPDVVLGDKKLYELLAHVDAIRCGKSREQKIAITKIEKLIKG